MELKDFKALSDGDIDLVLEALDNLKHKDFGGKVMNSLFKSMISRNMSPEEKARMEKEEELDDKKKELEMIKLKREIDLVKAKIILIRAERNQ